ncbi:MAG: M20 family metallopeptidase [Pseudomonadales bacterium]|nr:M20 family metallopeptidase [Pseudomonadales bacterium]
MKNNHSETRLRTPALWLLLWSLLASTSATAQVEPTLDAREREMVNWLQSREGEMLSLLERLTNINSGSLNKAGIDEIATIFADELRQLGFNVSSLPGEVISMPSCPGNNYNVDVADHLLASKAGDSSRLLLMGHMDTVFPPESPFQSFRRQGDIMSGPGVADMKGGMVVMLYALKALQEFNALNELSVSVLLNSDEEMGSLSSRKYLEEQARQHDWGLVYESSGTGNLTRQRKGLGQARVVVNGRASHAGGAHEQGRSAIKELAYKIVEIENMTDYESGVTVNVGLVSGGEARNTVAPCAEAFIDLRYPEPQQGEVAAERFEEIFNQVYSYPVDSGEITAESWVNLHRPPKIPTPESDYLLEKARSIGRLLGQELGVTDSGGGTDGSLTQAVGLPTQDSLGVAGTGAHSNREQARVSSLVERAQLSAVLIQRLAAETP